MKLSGYVNSLASIALLRRQLSDVLWRGDLIADFGGDFSAAHRCVKTILVEIIGVDENSRFFVYERSFPERQASNNTKTLK